MLVSDFNIDVLNVISSPSLSVVNSYGFENLVNEPICLGWGSATYLDHVLVRGLHLATPKQI